MPPESPIRLLIADDHELVRDGIRARLESHRDIQIVGEAADGMEAIEMAKELKPDLLMLDINMPQLNGLEAAAQLSETGPPCRILMLSLYDNPEYVQRARVLGTNGYLLKDVSQDEMIDAIKQAAEGGFYVSRNLSKALGEASDETDSYGLTEREREVLTSIARGKLNKQIAGELNISVRTVESHRSAIRQKTGGGNAAMLTKIAGELGLA